MEEGSILDERIPRGFCTFEVGSYAGIGAFVMLTLDGNGTQKFGLVTGNVICNEDLGTENVLIVKSAFIDEKICFVLDDSRFRFSCPLLGLTFIEIYKTEVDSCVQFLPVSIEKITPNKNLLFVRPQNKHINKQPVVVLDIFGFMLHFRVQDTHNTPIGLIFNNTGILHGIVTEIDGDFCKAQDLFYLSFAIRQLVENSLISSQYTIGNPRALTKDEVEQLASNGLQSTPCPEVFVSPKSDFVTPLYFYRTRYTWFWTPWIPTDYSIQTLHKCNWSVIHEGFAIEAISKMFNLAVVADRNVKLIKWLSQTKLQYLLD